MLIRLSGNSSFYVNSGLVITNETKLKLIPTSCPWVNLSQEFSWYGWINFFPLHRVPDKLLEKVLIITATSKISITNTRRRRTLLENLQTLISAKTASKMPGLSNVAWQRVWHDTKWPGVMNGRQVSTSSGGHWQPRWVKCSTQGEGSLHLRAPTNSTLLRKYRLWKGLLWCVTGHGSSSGTHTDKKAKARKVETGKTI